MTRATSWSIQKCHERAKSFPSMQRRITLHFACEWVLSVDFHGCTTFMWALRHPLMQMATSSSAGCGPIATSCPVSIVSNAIKANSPQADLPNSPPAQTQPCRHLSRLSSAVLHHLRKTSANLNMCRHPSSHMFRASTHELPLSHHQTLLYVKDFAFLSPNALISI